MLMTIPFTDAQCFAAEIANELCCYATKGNLCQLNTSDLTLEHM